MLITEEIFAAFLRCETKAWLKSQGKLGENRDFTQWQQQVSIEYKKKCADHLCSKFLESDLFVGSPAIQNLRKYQYRLIIDCALQTENIQSTIQALELFSLPTKKKADQYIPIRFIPNEKISKIDRLLLAFDALLLFAVTDRMPSFGKIIHGDTYRIFKVKLDNLINQVKSLIAKISAQATNLKPPELLLNKHCVECEFQSQCRQMAIEKGELTLLSGLNEKERNKYYNKGLFSINQLSYNYKPRRKGKNTSSQRDKYSQALKALAVRENKIHITGNLEWSTKDTPIYLDVEGIPDRDFYYLIGLRGKHGEIFVHQSFWANESTDEKAIWLSLLETLKKIENPQLIYYGNYEAVFLRRMKERYCINSQDKLFVDQLIKNSTNLLSVIYAKVYFPTYSNGLKEVAGYLGFQYSSKVLSGINSIIFRYQWELSKDAELKQQLLSYNREDCEALEIVANSVVHLCQRQNEANSHKGDVVNVVSVKTQSSYKFGKTDFLIPDLEYINQCAYWDYQRERIYIRSNKQQKRLSQKTSQKQRKRLAINKTVLCPIDEACPECKSNKIYKYGKFNKVVHDLKFSQTGIKRWVIRYSYNRFKCPRCNSTFISRYRPTRTFGAQLLAYVIYQFIDLQISQMTTARIVNELFGFHMNGSEIQRQKTIAANYYEEGYKAILNRILSGHFIHVDETKISIKGKSSYVWVITNLDEVAYFYTSTREGDKIQSLLKDFKGVLVSDFYSAYDSIACPQQKCLIHLIRDLNDELLNYPFNEELKAMVKDFALLMKTILETVDRFGLKAYYLRKHKADVERFYVRLSKSDFKTELVTKIKKRFERNRDKLFTFLDYDCVPWNNNNAEHAIKSFARLRRVIGGSSTEKGIQEYLSLLSLCETCRCKGINFLEFLRSRHKDIIEFLKNGRTKSNDYASNYRDVIDFPMKPL